VKFSFVTWALAAPAASAIAAAPISNVALFMDFPG
jgi:hypothetical protein